MTVHHPYIRRCIELAQRGAGFVAPNPMVGAVLVHNDKIIGEGWHQSYGQAHAEVNAIRQAAINIQKNIKNDEGGPKDLSQSVLYVSLEPCAHHGKTPPCADLIIKHKIPKVIIGCRDPFTEANGKGIEKLKAAGVNVEVGILEKECKNLNKRFLTFHTKKRPYIILKWAQTKDGKMAAPPPPEGEILKPAHRRLLISNEYSNRLVHKWRSEEASILVGTNTALLDNPELTTRLWDGPSPIRLVVDMNLRLPASLNVFNQQVKTIIFNSIKQEEKENLLYYKIEKNGNIVDEISTALYQLNIQSVLVEGGAKLLQSFIDERLWDEVRIIKNVAHPDSFGKQLIINNGLAAPVLTNAKKISYQKILSDIIETYEPKHS